MLRTNTILFSNKVDEYLSSRPSYSPESVNFIIEKCDLSPNKIYFIFSN